ncbi:MAG: hypothetical protein KatS3mg015_0874 [Fimbriimonadales bacterium]|nr:MAG: hypothetical protein KatS3mg015_0874 [Fimbriimonadales bacterium]
MKRWLCCVALCVWLIVGGCVSQGQEDGTKARHEAPPTEAPKETLGIEAPAKGTAKDARRIQANEGESPPPQSADREYVAGVTEKELGLPFYPGSKELRPGGVLRDSSGVAAQSFRLSDDDPKTIVSFYRKRLDAVLHEVREANGITLVGKSKGKECTIVVVQRSAQTEINVFTKTPKR